MFIGHTYQKVYLSHCASFNYMFVCVCMWGCVEGMGGGGDGGLSVGDILFSHTHMLLMVHIQFFFSYLSRCHL